MPRTASKGRKSTAKTPAKASPAKKAAAAATPAPAAAKMVFEENDEVLAKWPGTSLFFRAKVTYVREDDQEYDVQYEDGTIFTIKAKDVSKRQEVKPKAKPRSRSRGRSPGRKAKATPASPKASTSQTRASRSATRAAKPAATPKPAPATPTRQSARIAEKREFSADPAAAAAKKGPTLKSRVVGCVTSLASEVVPTVGALVFAALGPFILVSLHKLCTASACKPANPLDKIPTTLKAYWDQTSFVAFFAMTLAVRLLCFLPVGAKVKTASGNDVRMSGFVVLLLGMASMPVLVYKKVSLSLVTDKYFFLMTSAILLSVAGAVFARAKNWFAPEKKSNWNAKGNTGNPVVDLIYGREHSPYFLGADFKLTLFRISMFSLAMINVVLVVNSIMSKGGEVNPVVVLASSFQVLYALDAMFFEEYFLFSNDYMNNGVGLNLMCSYLTFPFIPTLITQYLILKNPVMKWYYLLGIAFVNAVGYIIFRASETQRCEFNKDPSSVKNLETISGAHGKKLLVSGWWGIVKHPNYLGELLIQWSWVLPAACTAGKVDLLVYYLPIMTTLVLIQRCRQQNEKNKRKFGQAWNTYSERVRSNLVPKVF